MRYIVILGVLSILESLVISQVGRIAGAFYRIAVEGQLQALPQLLVYAAFLYTLATLITFFTSWMTGWLSVIWRESLVTNLHLLYCSQEGLTKTTVSTVDQRMTQDAALLCDGLAALAKKFTAAPFRILFYGWLAYRFVGLFGLIGVVTFFLIGLCIQKHLILKVSRLVYLQENKEGDFRAAHSRLQEFSREAAASRGGAAEREALNDSLTPVIENQRSIAAWKSALLGITRGLDYLGTVLNYTIVALMAVTTHGRKASGGDGGDVAEFVSNASFYTLMLVNSLTELLDAADQYSAVVGLAARVSQLLASIQQQQQSSLAVADGNIMLRKVSIDGEELRKPELATLILPPTTVMDCMAEISIHQFNPSVGSALVGAVFADCPKHKPLFAVITFQSFQRKLHTSSLGMMEITEDSSYVNAHMDSMYSTFLVWDSAMHRSLTDKGFWCDSADPRTGYALHGPPGNAKWSEVAAAHCLLGYDRVEGGICPLIRHPLHGVHVYPATLLTDAPLPLLLDVLEDVYSPVALKSACLPLLKLDAVTIKLPNSKDVVNEVSIEVMKHQHTLIFGPNGGGKTTLLRAILGVYPLEHGNIFFQGGGQSHEMLCIPQRPISAPGPFLWHQLVYPFTERPNTQDALFLLHSAGLEYLIDRTSTKSIDGCLPAGYVLTPGELQRLSIIRILYHKPSLALLDEPVSAMSDIEGQKMYQKIFDAGITCLSIGQRSLIDVHMKNGGAVLQLVDGELRPHY